MTGTPFVWTDARVRRALGLDGEGADAATRDAPPYSGVSTDTRNLSGGELFVALRGERFDAHRFLDQAHAAGAAAAVVEAGTVGPEGLPLYEVSDTLTALGQLARYRRRALRALVIAVTGSSGKTTFKELLRAALSAHCPVHATRGNLNNRIGVPLTLLETPDEAEVVIVELGTNEPGEIATLTRIAEPVVGVVTTVSEAHLERLGSLEGVYAEKLDLVRELAPEGVAYVGDHPGELGPRAVEAGDDVCVVGFSEVVDPDYRGELEPVRADGRYPFTWRGRRVVPGIPGRHGADLTLMALVIATEMEVPPSVSIPGLEAVTPGPMRGELRRIGGLDVIVDCYNANPQSVRAALAHLASLDPLRPRVAVLGSMLELGTRSEALHRELLAEALALPLSTVVAVGHFSEAADSLPSGTPGTPGPAPRPRLLTATDAAEAWTHLRPHLAGDELILLKGSRGVALEAMLPQLEEAFTHGEGGEG